MSDITTTLRSWYGLEPVRLSGGYENEVYRVGDRVVRVAAAWIRAEQIADEEQVLRYMATHLPEAVAPERNLVHEGRYLTVFGFRDGTHLRRDDAEARLEAARLLARIHEVGLSFRGDTTFPGLAGLDWERNPMWDLDRVHAALEELASTALGRAAGRLDEELAWARGRVVEIARREPRTGILQGDYWPGNLLVTGGRVGAVVDWLETRRDWLCYELGRAAWEFCSDRADAPERRPHRADAPERRPHRADAPERRPHPREHVLLADRANSFLHAYLERSSWGAERELDLLVDLMRISVLTDVLRDLTYEGPTEEVAEYHIGSVRRLDRLAELRWP